MGDKLDVGRIRWDDPLAFFLTWTTYGSWLPGDDRGWVEKPGVFRLAEMERLVTALLRMTEDSLVLDHKQRSIVEATIRRHCEIRHWELHAVSCRTNHVHVVVTANRDPEIVMDQFKAWCTRHLKEDFRNRLQVAGEAMRENWWTQRGSKRVINDEDSLEAAIRYVLEGQ